MAGRFRKAARDERDISSVGHVARRKSLVVRYRGTGKCKPVPTVAHLDCVEAKREDRHARLRRQRTLPGTRREPLVKKLGSTP